MRHPNGGPSPLLLLTLAMGQVAQATDGQLDPSFDGDGRVIFAIPAVYQIMALTNNKINSSG